MSGNGFNVLDVGSAASPEDVEMGEMSRSQIGNESAEFIRIPFVETFTRVELLVAQFGRVRTKPSNTVVPNVIVVLVVANF
jgi:hypothetical protein